MYFFIIILIHDPLHVLIYYIIKNYKMKRSATILFILLLVFSCKPGEKEKKELFSLLSPARTNVDFTNKLTETEKI